MTTHRTGVILTPEVKAKISASRFLKREANPRLWELLYKNSLEKLQLIEELHGTRRTN